MLTMVMNARIKIHPTIERLVLISSKCDNMHRKEQFVTTYHMKRCTYNVVLKITNYCL